MAERPTETDIRYAYRVLLRRDADPGGLAHYQDRVREGMSYDGLIRSLMKSDEYHDRLIRDGVADQKVVDLGGYRVVVDERDPDFGQVLVGTLQYEEPVRAAVRERVHAGDVCVDIGANVGVMTFLAATLAGSSGRVIAVEPNPDNIQLLLRGIVLNGYSNVEVVPLAASDRRAIFSLTGRSNTHLESPRVGEGGSMAQSAPLDDLVGDLPRLDVVKMDAEGHEPAALRGFWRNLSRHRPALVVEFNPHCLAVQREDPRAYLDQVFRLTNRVRVSSAFGDDVVADQPDAVLSLWERRERELAAAGLLPPGLLHFDLSSV